MASFHVCISALLTLIFSGPEAMLLLRVTMYGRHLNILSQHASCHSGASKLAGRDGSETEQMKGFLAEIPLGHAQATWDIAITAVYLASEAARCVNGDTIVSRLPHVLFIAKMMAFERVSGTYDAWERCAAGMV